MKSAYFIGIKGVAMTALAIYLKEQGYEVSGSDVSEIFATDVVLKEKKIPVKKGFNRNNIQKRFDLVVVTGAHGGMTNPEAVYAKSLNLPVFMHGQALGMIMDKKTGISVAGCHGKTTTSSMIASLLAKSGKDPSYTIGTATITNLGAAGHFGKGEYFVAEADEYVTCPVTDKTPRFLWQHPKIMVLTNIEFDHPDVYANIEAVKKAYSSFLQNVARSGLVIACIDNEHIRSLLPFISCPFFTYGLVKGADYHIADYALSPQNSSMHVVFGKKDLGNFRISVPGVHNLENALATLAVGSKCGLSWESMRRTLPLFTGSKRRFERIGSAGNIFLYDDYAHHPSEIQATIEAVSSWFPAKDIVVIFQPHTYSRTKSLLAEFSASFSKASHVLVADIYPSAREKFDPSVSSEMLVPRINQIKKNAIYTKDKKAVLDWLQKNVNGNEIIITMGAGDIFSWHKDILGQLRLCYN